MLTCTILWSQDLHTPTLRGRVMSNFTKETVPFASIFWKKAGFGVVSDSAGNFTIKHSPFHPDTLAVSYVGFDELHKIINDHSKDSSLLILSLYQLKTGSSVEVKSKFNKGLRWWKNIVAHKAKNNPYQYQSYAYELYNKMEIDLNNVDRRYFADKKLLKPFAFILDNIDSTTETKPFLPIYLTEALSDYYYSTDPQKIREEIKAAKTDGMKNESMLQFVGGMNQKINVYSDQTHALGKEFISPLSTLGDRYYNYRGADTQYIGGQRYFHLFFTPKRDGENTVSGE